MHYDKPITIQVQDPETEEWTDKLKLHANVNKTGGGTVFNAGANQYNTSLTFRLRYVRALEDLAYNTQPYRILYRGRTFKVVDYDDYMEQHREIKLVGEYYG
jgi:SPP1 family predicted phage head-tail adaptor